MRSGKTLLAQDHESRITSSLSRFAACIYSEQEMTFKAGEERMHAVGGVDFQAGHKDKHGRIIKI